MTRWIASLCLFFLSIAPTFAITVEKQCHPVAGTDVSLGVATSVEIGSRSAEQQMNGGLTCDSSGVTVVGTNWIRVKINNSSDVALKDPVSGDSIPLMLYASASKETRLDYGTTHNYTAFTFIGGSPNIKTFPLYIAVGPTAARLHAGTYRATISLTWYWLICPNSQGLGVCYGEGWDKSRGLIDRCGWESCTLGPLNWGSGATTSVTVSLTIANDCIMNAPNVDFGTAPVPAAFSPQIGALSIRCTNGSLYTVGMSDGANAAGNVRQLRHAAGTAAMRYDIYKSATGTDRWGSAGAERRASTTADLNGDPGSHNGSANQVFNYRIEIPAQHSVPAGTYTDNVVVDVKF